MNRERLLAAAAAAVPGLLAGIHLTGLLFFLNPHLPFRLWPVVRTGAWYGALGALSSCVVLMAVCWRRPERTPRILPWSIAAVFGIGAALDLLHAARYVHFLPPGIHDRLTKAGLWLALAALITAWTALAHTWRRRRLYGERSRFGIAGLAVLTVYSVFERREAFEPPPQTTPRAAVIQPAPPPNLLILGLDGASLDAILPLAEQGLLPFFAETMRNGSYARAESIEPAVGLPLWTTLVTGKYPFRHGVVAEQTRGAPSLPGERFHLTPAAIGFGVWGDRGAIPGGPPAKASAPPLWRIAGGFGIRSAVMDAGIGLTSASAGRTVPLGSAMIDERLARLGDGPPSALYTAALRDLEAQRQLLDTLEGQDGESPLLAFVLMDGLADVSRLYYDSYEAVQFDGDQSQARIDRARWLSAYYAFLDGLVEEAWEQLQPPRFLAVVSAHGFRRSGPVRRLLGRWGHAPTIRLGGFQTPDGLLLLRGPEIEEDLLLTGLGIQDVAPTLLYAMNLPVARDIDGRVITEAFEPTTLARRPIAVVSSYEAEALDAGRQPSWRNQGASPDDEEAGNAKEADAGTLEE